VHVRAVRLNGCQCLVGVDVAGASAILELSGRVKHGHWLKGLRVHLRPEPIRVTGRTVRLVCGEFPGHHLRVRCVAGATRDCCPVIWIEGRGVPVVNECPCRGTVAGFTWQNRREMPGSRSGRGLAIVTTCTPRGQTAVIHAGARECDRALVTGFTRRSRCDVIGRLSGGTNSCMTRSAWSSRAAVIQPRAGKCIRTLMTGFAWRCGYNMPRRLADRT
jgi:hypothetical protein